MDGMSWIEFAYNMLDDWFQVVVVAGVFAALLAIVVLVINILFRHWLSAGQMGLLWGLVLIRLLVPMSPASPLGLANLLTYTSTESVEAPLPAQEAIDEQAVAANPTMDNVRKLTDLNLPTAPVEVSTATDDSIDSIFSAIPLVWFIGGALGLAWTVASYARFCRRVRQTPDCTDKRLQRLWQTCCETAGVKHTGRLLQFDGVEQPAIMGVFWPTLLLPSDTSELADDQLRMVMLHELAHVRRWDIAANWLLAVIRAIHWWNPVYWLAAARFRSLREQACDAFVVRRSVTPATQNYGALLLALAERPKTASAWRVMLPASILSFVPSIFRRRSVRTRLRALRTAGAVHGRWHTAAVAGVVLLLVVSGFTDASNPEAPTDAPTFMGHQPMDVPMYMALPSGVTLPRQTAYSVEPTYDGPKETRTYDIAKCLERIAEDAGSKEGAAKQFEATLNTMYAYASKPTDEGTHSNVYASDGVKAKEREPTPVLAKPPALTYTITATTLTAEAPAALQEKLQHTLDAWAESGLSGQIVVTEQFVSASRDLISGMGISWQFLEAFSSDRGATIPARAKDGMPVVRAEATVDVYLPIVVATLDRRQTAKLIDIAQGDRRANVLNAPKITIFNGQEAVIADCSQRPFVVGVFQKVAGANEPKVVVIEEGTRINVRGILSRDQKKLHLETSVNMSALGDVTTATTSFRGQQVSIQVPRVNRQSIDVVSDVDDGHTLLIGFVPTDKQKHYSYYLLTAERISEDADTKPRSDGNRK
jgi:bla regulator protein blaR1